MTSERWALDAGTQTMMRLSEELRLYFRSRIGDSREAEDLVNSTWLDAARTFEGRCKLRHYLYAIAQRKVVTWWRIHRHRPWFNMKSDDPDSHQAFGPDLDEELSDRYERGEIDNALAGVPELFREVIALRLGGYAFDDISRLLGVKYHTVRSRYARGLTHLKNRIEEGPAESDEKN